MGNKLKQTKQGLTWKLFSHREIDEKCSDWWGVDRTCGSGRGRELRVSEKKKRKKQKKNKKRTERDGGNRSGSGVAFSVKEFCEGDERQIREGGSVFGLRGGCVCG
ncbi:hypothetical protein L1049_017905 [Liquidambar formosana]|uniref:Uncharacterized protein n=1 Tax=Liquidambar formosana TaxID=63359 RepID=A0AAP0NI37_LIQFO